MHGHDAAEAEEDPCDELAGGLARLERDDLWGRIRRITMQNSPNCYAEFAELLGWSVTTCGAVSWVMEGVIIM